LVREFREKKEIALKLLVRIPVISMQVINENINVCHKKFGLPAEIIQKHIEVLFEKCLVSQINKETTEIAIKLIKKYKYSYFDSLIIASALENNCKILYSEDLQHNQVIENPGNNGAGKLTIVNPF
jgi:predicted nucleic acid-binding protein